MLVWYKKKTIKLSFLEGKEISIFILVPYIVSTHHSAINKCQIWKKKDSQEFFQPLWIIFIK